MLRGCVQFNIYRINESDNLLLYKCKTNERKRSRTSLQTHEYEFDFFFYSNRKGKPYNYFLTVLSDTCLTLQWRTAVCPTTAVTLWGEMSSNSGLCTGVPFCDVGCTFCCDKLESTETRTKTWIFIFDVKFVGLPFCFRFFFSFFHPRPIEFTRSNRKSNEHKTFRYFNDA